MKFLRPGETNPGVSLAGVIWDTPAPFNAPERCGLGSRSLPLTSGNRLQIGHKVVCGIVIRTGRVAFARRFTPGRRINWRKARVALGVGMDLRDLEPRGERHGLRIEFRRSMPTPR